MAIVDSAEGVSYLNYIITKRLKDTKTYFMEGSPFA